MLLKLSEHNSQVVALRAASQHLTFLSLSYTRESEGRGQTTVFSLAIFCAILDQGHLVMQRSYQSHRAWSKEFRIQLQESPVSQR